MICDERAEQRAIQSWIDGRFEQVVSEMEARFPRYNRIEIETAIEDGEFSPYAQDDEIADDLEEVLASNRKEKF
jgi:hypothetical protein